MNPALISGATQGLERPWWKESYLWLVIGGPLVVVVAALATMVIAFKHIDPVIDKNEYQQEVLMNKRAADDALVDELSKFQPAHQARNNAASPVVPGVSKKN
jgi:hypothetical protein